MGLIELAERGVLPDLVVRAGIRRLLKKRLKQISTATPEAQADARRAIIEELKASPVAEHTEAANDQHYEVPSGFFQLVLGPRLKYSCTVYPDPNATLQEAEEHMLELTCRRAELTNGQDILELGCGWGSLTLWMAEQYPQSRITAVSNSHGQRKFIEEACRDRNLENVRVITADVCEFQAEQRFDRVVSVEMFEHMRNYQTILARIAGWLRPKGKLFIHVFCHRDSPYLFETEGNDNWMGRHFFTGGLMPSEDLLAQFQEDVVVQDRWNVSGLHYARTCRHWLENLDKRRADVLRSLATSSPTPASISLQRWRMFFMACEELFRFHGGREWYVTHYLFQPRSTGSLDADAESSSASTDYPDTVVST